MYNHLSRRMPDNRFTRRYLADFPKMAEEYRRKPIVSIPYSLFRMFRADGSRAEYEREYFDVRKRCDVLAAMVLCGHNEYLEDLQNTICAILEEYTWAVPAHIKPHFTIQEEVTAIDLFAAETALMISEIWYLLHDELEEEVSRRMVYELHRRITDPFVSRAYNWPKNNWSAVCGHGVLTAFVYLGLDEELKTVLPRLCASMDDFLGSYKDDGYSSEGALYWSYGFESFVYAASLIREYTKGEIDYFRQEKVHAIARYGFYTYFGDNKTLPFADSPHRLNFNIGLYHFLKHEYPELPLPDESRAAMFGDESRCRFFEMMRNLYWFDETMPTAEQDQQQVCVDFPESQVYIRRMAQYYLVCKGGHNGEEHNHNDVGSFAVICGDDYVLDDPGWQEYDREYFGPRRYTDYICAMSLGHSAPIINGCAQKEGREFEAKVLRAEKDRICLDLSGAYDLSGVSVIRTFQLKENTVVVEDSVSGANSVIERFVTRIAPQQNDDGSWEISGHRLDGEGTSALSSQDFIPRLVSNIGGKPLETIYMIDYVPGDPEHFTVKLELHA